jgi:hypothetical protein
LQRSAARRLYDLLVAREGVYGIQDKHGWRTVREKLTIDKLERHLAGEFRIGTYSFTPRGLVKWICLDSDIGTSQVRRVLTGGACRVVR